jgi:hypothetical protein
MVGHTTFDQTAMRPKRQKIEATVDRMTFGWIDFDEIEACFKVRLQALTFDRMFWQYGWPPH